MTFRVEMKIPPELVSLADHVNRNLVDKILPRALNEAAMVVEEFLIAELPDGTESRKLQTAAVRAKFPDKVKNETGIKKVRKKKHSVMRVVGVKSKRAGQVHFDHGDKGRGRGRIHVLWGKGFAKVNPRQQKHDVALMVRTKAEPMVFNIVQKHIDHAIRNGEVL